MRRLIVSTLKNDATIAGLVGTRVYAANSLGVARVPQSPKKPFIVVSEMDAIALSRVAPDTAPDLVRKPYQFYVHDEKGSYVRIDNIVDAIKAALRPLVSSVDPSGARCLEVLWNGLSRDLEDPSYDSFMRFATMTFTSTK